MTPVRVLGVGSPFGDDRIGWEVVAALRDSGLLDRFPPDWVSAAEYDRPGSGLIALIEGAHAVILVDATDGGAPPGSVQTVCGEAIAVGQAITSSHGFGIAESIALARVLGMLPPVLTLYGIEQGSLAAGADLSSAVRAGIPKVLSLIGTELDALLQTVHRPTNGAVAAQVASP
jgi:hydrogenase maturation protease